ncbi:MAG: Mth938-like domain-containing protein [Longimicrobiales bacterium]
MADTADIVSSPRIEEVSWGEIRVTVEDGDAPASYKDAKLFPGGSRAWDWKETGTSHDPGIQAADVEELLEKGARVVVLARGMNRRLKVQDSTLRHLEEEGVETRVEETKEAVRVYNDLQADGKPVGGLFHTTC